MSIFGRVGEGLRRMTSMVFSRSTYRMFFAPGSHVDYEAEVGNATASSTVAAPLRWMARTFPEAPPSLWQTTENGQEEQVRDHPMLRLMTRPNRYYTGPNLWMATVTDWNVDGNAYWLKLRNGAGAVEEIWWVPHWLIDPVGDEGTFIDHYRYMPGTEALRIDKDDIVHFRNGLDEDDPKLGSSPLKSVLREVFTDNEAAAFTASLLRNMGVPGLVVSPGAGVSISQESAAEVKRDISEKFTGDRRGEAIVMTGATEIAQFGFSPEQLVLRDLRRIPEERVTAVLGVPAIVAGLGAGLDRSTFTNMGEARAAAYESGLIPMQRIMSEDIRFQLLNEFEDDPFLWRFGFDLTKVRVLQEDLLRTARRCDLMIRGGWMQVAEGRREMGLPVDDSRDRIFIRQLNVVDVPAAEGVEVRPPANADAIGRVDEIGQQLSMLEQAADAGFKDLRAVVEEWRPPPPVVQLPPVVNFHEGAFQAAPAPNVNVEAGEPPVVNVAAAPAPNVHVEPQRPTGAKAVRNPDGTMAVVYEYEDEPTIKGGALVGNGNGKPQELETSDA